MRKYLILFLSLICFTAIAQQPIKNFERAQTKFDIPIARVPIVKNGDTTYYQVYGSLQGLLDSVGITIPITDSLNQRGNALRSSDSLFYRQCPTCPYNFVTKIDTSNVNEYGTLTSPLVGFIYYKSCPTCPNQIIPDRFGYIQDFGSNKSIIFATGEDIEFNDGDGYINLVGGPTTYRLQEDTLNEIGNLNIIGDSIYYQKCPTCIDSLVGVMTGFLNQGEYRNDAHAGSFGVLIDEYYEAAANNTMGLPRGTLRRRKY